MGEVKIIVAASFPEAAPVAIGRDDFFLREDGFSREAALFQPVARAEFVTEDHL